MLKYGLGHGGLAGIWIRQAAGPNEWMPLPMESRFIFERLGSSSRACKACLIGNSCFAHVPFTVPKYTGNSEKNKIT
jgi:hypothetical protein